MNRRLSLLLVLPVSIAFALACASGVEEAPAPDLDAPVVEVYDTAIAAEAMRREIEARQRTETIEVLHGETPKDAADSFHVIVGSFEDVMEAWDKSGEVGLVEGQRPVVLDSTWFAGLTDGYWVVSAAHGEKDAMDALCEQLEATHDCYVKNAGARVE